MKDIKPQIQRGCNLVENNTECIKKPKEGEIF